MVTSPPSGCRRLQAKDLAIALEPHLAHLQAGKRDAGEPALARVVRGAWLLDAAGDIGNRSRSKRPTRRSLPASRTSSRVSMTMLRASHTLTALRARRSRADTRV